MVERRRLGGENPSKTLRTKFTQRLGLMWAEGDEVRIIGGGRGNSSGEWERENWTCSPRFLRRE